MDIPPSQPPFALPSPPSPPVPSPSAHPFPPTPLPCLPPSPLPCPAPRSTPPTPPSLNLEPPSVPLPRPSRLQLPPPSRPGVAPAPPGARPPCDGRPAPAGGPAQARRPGGGRAAAAAPPAATAAPPREHGRLGGGAGRGGDRLARRGAGGGGPAPGRARGGGARARLGPGERGGIGKGGGTKSAARSWFRPHRGGPFLDTWPPPGAGRRRENQLRELILKPPLCYAPLSPDPNVAPGLTVRVLEASVEWQERLVERAVDALGRGSADVDPYGAAVWPAAQVLAQAVAAWVAAAPRPPSVLELGAGCGLASLTAAAMGASVTATDFRELPLELVAEAARRQGLAPRLRTALFDVRASAEPVPPADLVAASDVLYDRDTAVGVAGRIAEARERGSAVLVADVGRPNRGAFLEELGRLRPHEEAAFACRGRARQLVVAGPSGPGACAAVGAESDALGKETRVEILELPPGPASAAVRPSSPSTLWRPRGHGHVL
ncbi:unnamed protein product [Prorocentrum cordatum]|uniref:Methyltransferase domain-containing protein n=1 Tax=Prorocentrum cordatum TaxID=2364126 RepID=A0ABN9SCE1_9DINO|nr:unnamed protein product [Polarella glacialis]